MRFELIIVIALKQLYRHNVQPCRVLAGGSEQLEEHLTLSCARSCAENDSPGGHNSKTILSTHNIGEDKGRSRDTIKFYTFYSFHSHFYFED